jgi:hypothetical protein
MLFCHHGYQCGARAREDGAIGVNGMGADENSRNLRNDRTQGR